MESIRFKLTISQPPMCESQQNKPKLKYRWISDIAEALDNTNDVQKLEKCRDEY